VLDFEARHDWNPDPDSAIGVFFNDSIWEAGQVYQARVIYQVMWNGFRQPPHPVLNPDPTTANMECRTNVILRTPGKHSIERGAFLAHHPVPIEEKGQPRTWRQVRIIATPAQLRATLVDKGQESDFSVMPRRVDELQGITKKLTVGLFPERAGLADFNYPNWGPKGSLGLVVQNGIGSFRNVVVTPIRNP
jgi:hypothetical protein